MATNRQNLIIAGLPNFVAADVTSITAGADAGGTMGKDNLKTQEPWEIARLTSVFPHLSYWEVDLSVALPVEAVALVNHSLIPGDQLRVVGVTSGALPAVRSEVVLPAAIIDSDNIVGVIDDIDDDPASGGNSPIVPSVSTDPWFIHVTFGDPAEDPAAGDKYQCFVLRVRQSQSGLNASDYGTVTAALYQSGVFLRTIGTKTVTEFDDYSHIIFEWDIDGFTNPDGSTVELRLDFEPGSATPVPAQVHLDALAWYCLYESDLPDVGSGDLDTGWITMIGAEAESSWGNTAVQEVDLPPPLWHHLMVATSLQSLRVEFRADGVGYFANFVATPPRIPSGVIDAGVLLVAPAFEAPYNFAPGGSLRSRPALIGDEEAITGANRAIAAYRKRTCEAEFPLVPETTAHSLFARLDNASQGTAAFLLVLEPQKTGTIARNTTFWAISPEARGLIYQEGFDDAGEPIRSMGYLFEEKL